jgi:RNA polymerase sigma factor (sigma-70 family)
VARTPGVGPRTGDARCAGEIARGDVGTRPSDFGEKGDGATPSLRGPPPVPVTRSRNERLFAALREGDEDALRVLLPPLRERLTRFAKLNLRGELAEEVAQETLRTLWEKRSSIEDAGHVLPFLFQVLRHKIGNAYQRARLERASFPSGVEAHDPPAGPRPTDPDRVLEGRELDRILREAIRRCAAENRTWGRILQLLREERSPSEIRRELGDIPMATVHTRIFRARKRLREILREEFRLDV